MRFSSLKFLLVPALLMLTAIDGRSAITIDGAAKNLPDRIESFRAIGPAQFPTVGIFELIPPDAVGGVSHAVRAYRDDKGFTFTIDLVRTQTDSGAYALLTRLADGSEVKPGVVGTAGMVSPNLITFFRGTSVVQIRSEKSESVNQERLLQFARSFAAGLESGEDDLPVLVKHLPNWETAQPAAKYAVSLEGLRAIVTNQQTLLEAISFDGDTEAVAAYYGQSQLLIVEFSTPQFSVDNDRQISARINELRAQKQPGPTAYRRVGNYSVFVFNAPDEKTANELIDQVKYEKVVQWLGDNPHWYEKAVREWAQTSAGVMMAVLKSSGLSLIACLALGGAIGALMFRRRRALQKEATLYSDAGGMVRLNLDEMTGEVDPARLLTDGTKR